MCFFLIFLWIIFVFDVSISIDSDFKAIGFMISSCLQWQYATEYSYRLPDYRRSVARHDSFHLPIKSLRILYVRVGGWFLLSNLFQSKFNFFYMMSIIAMNNSCALWHMIRLHKTVTMPPEL